LGFNKEFHPQLQMSTGVTAVGRTAAVSNRAVTNVGTLQFANDAITNLRSEITIRDAVETGTWTVSAQHRWVSHSAVSDWLVGSQKASV
jgi:hypothetical protein